MTRNLFDAASPDNIPAGATFIAGYLTGTPGQAWLGHHMDVSIDQGSTGAPRYDANVIDVEPNAYRPQDVPGWVAKCTAPRPTVYCDQNDYPAVRALWAGDLWLSANGLKLPPDPNVIGIQNLFAGNYDRSDIFDPYWPNKPTTETEQDVIILKITGDGNTYLFNGTTIHHVESTADEAAFVAAGLKVVTISPAQFDIISGAVSAQ